MSSPAIWTPEQVLALAPDATSAKAGRELSQARKWLRLGRSETTVWGELQGSAKDPYRACVDLGETAFSCTCPSRKFPCKHTLGLLLALAQQPGAFDTVAPPAWAVAWLEARRARALKKSEKSDLQASDGIDLAAQAKRVAARESKVAAGVADTLRWLTDIARMGLAEAQSQPLEFWQRLSARLIDAQAPGLAGQVVELASAAASGDGWQDRMLEATSRIFALASGYTRLSALPSGTQADIRSALGWTVDQDALLSQPGVRDVWLSLGHRVIDANPLATRTPLRTRRAWLLGRKTGRAALLLSFAVGAQPFEAATPAGADIDAELVFYPGAASIRALAKRCFGASSDPFPFGFGGIDANLAAYGEAIAANPWLPQHPMRLGAVSITRWKNAWHVCDAAGDALPISPRFAEIWRLVALSGGLPLDLFGEWDGETVCPISAWADGRTVAL